MEETDQPSLTTLKDNFTRFEVRRVLQGEDLEQAKQPYSCLFGEEENALHDDLSRLSKIVMICSSQTRVLDQQQIKAVGNNQIPMESWSKVIL